MAVECIWSSFRYKLCTYFMRHFLEKQHFFISFDRRFADCYLFIRKSTIPILYRNRMKNKETSMTFKSQHISVSSNRPTDQVYEFVSNPEKLPKWATGLSSYIKNVNGDWIAESPMGRVKVKFADKNKFGILDHDVTLPSGAKVYNPVRVFPNNDGSESIFTLYRLPVMSAHMFA